MSPYPVSSARAAGLTWSDIITPTILMIFGAVFITLVGALVTSVANLRRVQASSEAVTTAYTTRVALQELVATITEAEASQRGFIITNLPQYLDPYEKAMATLPAELARIRAIAAPDPGQQADAEELTATVSRWVNELAEGIRLRRESDMAADEILISTNVGRRSMEEIQVIVGRMESREDAALPARTAEAATSYRVALWTAITTTGFGLLAVAALLVATTRYGSLRARAMRAAEKEQALLRRTVEEKDDFVALVAHELRTPANTILGWARMLNGRRIKPEQSAHAVRVLERSADALTRLLRNLLDAGQMLSGETRLTRNIIQFEDVVFEAMEAVRLSAEDKGVLLSSDCEPDLPLIEADEGRLKQVATNLLVNAIKFTPPGGEVKVVVGQQRDALRLEVIDTGEGIDPESLPYVFERYRQGMSGAKHHGIGLGLAIVRHLVELHRGTVSVHSDGKGHGATVVVTLPTIGTLEALHTAAVIARQPAI